MNNAELWRQKSRAAAVDEAAPLELPSGMVIMARRPGPALLAGYGRLPLGLAAAASEFEATGDGEGAVDAVSSAEFIRDLLLYCVVDPAISLHPRAGEIHPREIPDADLKYILHWAFRGEEAASLETFRTKPDDGRAGHNRLEVPGAAVDTAGDRGPGARPEPRSGSDRRFKPARSGSR